MNASSLHRRRIAVLAFAFASVLPMSGAQAQWYSSFPQQPPPLYPYVVQQPAIRADQPYAIEVAPGAYVIQRPAGSYARPPKRGRTASVASAPAAL